MKKVFYLSLVIILFCLYNSYSQKWKVLENYEYYMASIAKDGNYLFAGSMDKGIYVSSNNGSKWQLSNKDLTEIYIDPIFIQNHKIFAGTNNGIFISLDSGQSWKKYDSTLNNQEITKIFTFKNTLYAYDVIYRYLYISNDDGLHWDTLSNTRIDALCFQSQGDSLFLGGRKGIYLSLDSGRTWKIFNSIEEDWVYNMFISDNIFYFVTGLSSVYLSKDYGVNWEIKYFPDNYANDIFLVKDIIYVNSYRWGLSYSNNNGNSWVELKNTKVSYPICTNFISLIDNTFYCGLTYINSEFSKITVCGGLYSLDLDFLDVEDKLQGNNNQIEVFPNPATDKTNLQITIKYPSVISYSIYNCLGTKLYEFDNNNYYYSGNQNFNLDLNGYKPGTYFIKTQINSDIRYFKIIVKEN